MDIPRRRHGIVVRRLAITFDVLFYSAKEMETGGEIMLKYYVRNYSAFALTSFMR